MGTKALGCIATFVIVSWGQQAALMRLAGEVGDKYTYAAEMTMRGLPDGGEVRIKMTLHEELTKVGGGKFTWHQTYSNITSEGEGELAMVGSFFKLMEAMKMEIVYDERAQFISASVNGQPVPAEVVGGTLDVTFPRDAVKPGDKWTGEQTVNNRKVKMEYTYEAEETVDRMKAWRYSGRFVENEMITSNTTAMFWIEQATGKLIKAEGAFTAKFDDKTLITSYRIERK